MAVKKKNRISVLVMTLVTVMSLAGSLYAGSGREGDVYDHIKTFFTPADTDAVFYDEATRTTINYEVVCDFGLRLEKVYV